MGVCKVVTIDDKEVKFKASAAIPRIYRVRFNRDIYQDLLSLEKNMKSNKQNGLDIGSLEIFENIAYIMAKHADPKISNNVEEWLDQFSTFSIYHVLPEIIELWGLNLETKSQSKKHHQKVRGK